jgi:hypothetical protein
MFWVFGVFFLRTSSTSPFLYLFFFLVFFLYIERFVFWSRESQKMADRIHRITMFKLPNPEDQARLLEKYKVMATTHEKVCLDFPTFPLLFPILSHWSPRACGDTATLLYVNSCMTRKKW